MSTATVPTNPAWLNRASGVSFIVGAIGLVICAAGLFSDPTSFYRAWLVGFWLWLGTSIGALLVLMIQYRTGGPWGFAIRRLLEAATRGFPLMVVFFVPLLFGLNKLYEWAVPEIVEKDPILSLPFRQAYFSTTALAIKAIACLGWWGLLIWLFNNWSAQSDATRDKSYQGKCEALAAPGILFYAVAITVFAIDYLMSLEPHWYSTIYGVMVGWGQVLTAYTLTVLMFTRLSYSDPVKSVATKQTISDLGSLLLAFTMVWAYLSLMQFLLIWSGNIPEEMPWYQARMSGPWGYVGVSLMVLHFVAPFLLLLTTDIKRHRDRLALVCCLLLVMRVVDTLWLIVPSYEIPAIAEKMSKYSTEAGSWGPILYPAAILGIGGVWLGLYFMQLQRMTLVPTFNPKEAASHGAATH